MEPSPGTGTDTPFCLFLSPQEQLDIPIPKYFLKEKLEIIRGREKILAQILADSGLDMAQMVRTPSPQTLSPAP